MPEYAWTEYLLITNFNHSRSPNQIKRQLYVINLSIMSGVGAFCYSINTFYILTDQKLPAFCNGSCVIICRFAQFWY